MSRGRPRSRSRIRLAVLGLATLAGSVISAMALAPPAAAAVADPASVVRPVLGTSNGGNTFPGADAPFGMVQWSPDTNSRRQPAVDTA